MAGRFETRVRHQRESRLKAKARKGAGSGHFFGAAWALLNLALLRSYHGVAGIRLLRNGLIAVMAGGAIALGGVYVYRMMKTGGDDSIRIANAGQSLDENTEKAESRPSGKKLIYARLTPDGPATEPPPVPSVSAGPPKLPNAGQDNQTDGPPPEGKPSGNTPAISQTVPGETLAVNHRTVVRGETYLPDGTRIDVPRPAPIPSIVRLGAGKIRPPFLAAAQAPEAAAARTGVPEANAAPAAGPAEANAAPAAAVVQVDSAPAPEPAQGAEPAPSLESGYFAQVKADQDQKAADAELAEIAEKYKDVLGDVPVKTRSFDLKEKGVWIRVLAGPLKSYDEAAGLCKKLKGAGAEGCFVQKFD